MENLSGTIQFLTVDKQVGSTYFLLSEDKQKIRMNQSELTDDIEIGEEVSAFIYPNKAGELFATPKHPEVTVDKYGYGEVTQVNREGALLDVGAPREVLVPWVDLPKLKEVWPKVGDKIYIKLRAESDNQLFGRLITEQEVADRFNVVSEEAFKDLKNKWLKARPYRLLRVGTFLLSEEGYKVFVHESERESEPRLGEEVWIRPIGLNELGEINASFRQKSYRAQGEDADKILAYIKDNGGTMPLDDKSSPEDIKEAFQISKGAFKRALGKLMKENIVEQRDGQTVLKDDA